MKNILLLLIITTVISSCGKEKPAPSGRLKQPSGEFSFVTPEGWFRNKVTGVDFIIVYAEADYGIKPNIFVDFVSQSPSLDTALSKLATIYEDNRDYRIIEQFDFERETRLQSVKILSHRKTKKQLPLASFHYLIAGGDRVISITCTCAKVAIKKYEPIFDQTISTLEIE